MAKKKYTRQNMFLIWGLPEVNSEWSMVNGQLVNWFISLLVNSERQLVY